MQIQLPSPEQIYDLSTDQLSKLRGQLQLNISKKQQSKQGNSNSTDELESLKQLLENISLQIQERKTIQFFTQLCINDGTANKYVKEITDFNNEFKKLANQLLNNHSEIHQNQTQTTKTQYIKNTQREFISKHDQKSKSSFSYNGQQNTQEDKSISHISKTQDQFYKENHTIGTETSDFTKSNAQQMTKNAGKTITKKMGLGHGTNMKKSKNSMQQFIRATLAKSKAVDYVSTKGGTLKKSPDQIANNGSHISNHHQQASTPLSTTKSIKPPSQGSDTGSYSRKQVQSSNKTIPSSQKSINQKNDRDSLIKKRNEAIQKMKTMKKPQTHSSNQNNPPQPPKKKGTKGMDAKSLVEMVKQQQDAKKKRDLEPLQERPKPKQQTKHQKVNQKEISQTKQQKLTEIESENLSNQQANKSQGLISKTDKPSTKQTPSKIEQKQSEFPIKQQINPVSSSDTESDTDSVKLSNCRNSKKKSSIKQPLRKEEQYCPIPEEQIQESVVFIKNQQKTNIITKTSQVLEGQKPHTNQINTKKPQSSTKNNNTQVLSVKDSKQVINNQPLTSNKQQKVQIFGKITQEEYNPNGYEAQQNQQTQQLHQQQEVKSESQQESNVADLTTEKKQKVSKGTQSTKSVKIKQPNLKKTSSKNLKSKQQKKTVIDQETISPALKDFQNNKMYNEEYWLHIKQEAETKIQRFKQEKQIQRKQRQHKAKLIQQESKRIKSQLQNEKNKKIQKDQFPTEKSTTQDNTNQNHNSQIPISLEDDDNDKFIQQQKSNLKKIYNQNNTNGSSKKTSKKPQTVAIIKQPKPSYPRPQFNYLQIYPTFNHIFNVFYTKPSAQAVLDIPLVMKQMIEMFQTHLDYQKSKTNNFRPAIFMPFDNRNSKMNQFNDARLLLQHAQTTYINLKTLVERVDIFNSNIQGEFQNCTQEERANTQFYRVVKTKEQVYDIISTSFLRRKGWKQLPHGQNLKANWNLFWSWSKPQIDMNKLIVFQRINHYPFNKNLSRKDLLYKNIDSFRKTHKVSFPFLPITYNLPKEFTQFSKKFHEEELVNREKNYWIMKPIGKSRGRGIKLINSLGDLNYLDNIVVQKYIANPLLIDGYKFDMRIYVLVTSFHPLEAFVYREGFARLSTQKYSLQPTDMKNNFVHLTNFAINRHNQQANQQFTQGSKISLKSLKQRVTKMGYSFASVWSQVHQIIIKSLLACSVSVPPFPAAFQLFGYDIMIDDTGQCSLIEVNASPSLQRTYMIDQIIKQSLIDDIIQIVNPPAFSKQQAINVMNERLSPDFRNYKKGQKTANVDQEDLIHLARILKYQKMRKYGQMPQKIGLFEMVAPSPMSKDLEKLIKSKSGINAPHNID